MPGDRYLGCADELVRQGLPHLVVLAIAELGQGPEAAVVEGLGGPVLAQDEDGALAVEGADVARELREAEGHESVELPHAVAGVLRQPVVESHQLAQLVHGLVPWRGHGGPLLRGEACDAQGIDGIGLRPCQEARAVTV
ncbi:MAG TPA: hypothetical protein VFM88_14630 [Vicinamibacteria bacterium]|nr:hypothetical protein [Vicinamibacteria bacterium]